jgi:ech hydrogenase subunit E
MSRTIVPFGPQHPVLPEPIHLDLVLEDEKVVEAIPQIGFVHRGLEKLAEKREYTEMLYVAERICGICSCIHGHGYCEAIEALMKIEIPPRGKYLRVIYDELSRIHSHLLWLGLVADSFGFESLFMHCWRIRESVLDIVEELTGGRVIFGIHKIGGVRKDIAPDNVKNIMARLKLIEKECKNVTSIFENDGSVKRRQCGIGILTKEQAYLLGAVGPTLRGSGVNWDARKLGYSAYKDLSWEPCVEKAGDCYARTIVRTREIYLSFNLIYQAADKLPEGPFEVPVKGNPTGEYFARLEQPRGEVVYYVKGNGTKNLERFRVRTPTFANIPALVTMLQGEELPSVPVITLTIDPCISCTER